MKLEGIFRWIFRFILPDGNFPRGNFVDEGIYHGGSGPKCVMVFGEFSKGKSTGMKVFPHNLKKIFISISGGVMADFYFLPWKGNEAGLMLSKRWYAYILYAIKTA